ncbi:MAG TPA: hypothetical protein ENN17_01420, partial [bacterium]|nr:hypothetical protein [bacterium]
MAKSKKTESGRTPSGKPAAEPCAGCGETTGQETRRSAFGRFFCSLRCLFRFASRRAGSAVVSGFASLFPLRRGKLRIAGEAVMLTALIVCIIALIRLGRQVDRLNDRIFLAAGPAAEADTSGLPPAEMSPHIQGGMVTRNRIDIDGRADENWILSLSIDDRVDRVTLP